MAKRIRYSATFKAKVALAALKENKTLSELTQEYKIQGAQITKWKSHVTQEVSTLFENNRKKKIDPGVDVDVLYAQIGKLQTQLEFLKKKIGAE